MIMEVYQPISAIRDRGIEDNTALFKYEYIWIYIAHKCWKKSNLTHPLCSQLKQNGYEFVSICPYLNHMNTNLLLLVVFALSSSFRLATVCICLLSSVIRLTDEKCRCFLGLMEKWWVLQQLQTDIRALSFIQTSHM